MKPAEIESLPVPAPEPAPEPLPQKGGSYRRNADGTLTPVEGPGALPDKLPDPKQE